MPVPSDFDDLSTTPGLNSPVGSVDTPSSLDDYLRTAFAFLKQLYDDKAEAVDPTFTGDIVLPSTTTIGDVSPAELSYLNGVTSAIQTQLAALVTADGTLTTNVNLKAPIASPTFTGVPAGPTAAEGTNTTQFATTAFATTAIATAVAAIPDAAGLGVGQAWQNVLASRSAGVTYTNSTDKPIFVSVSFPGGGASGGTGSLTIDGVEASHFNNANTSGVGIVCGVVPAGDTYVVTLSAGTLRSWAELR